jgi:hypothetical protein
VRQGGRGTLKERRETGGFGDIELQIDVAMQVAAEQTTDGRAGKISGYPAEE